MVWAPRLLLCAGLEGLGDESQGGGKAGEHVGGIAFARVMDLEHVPVGAAGAGEIGVAGVGEEVGHLAHLGEADRGWVAGCRDGGDAPAGDDAGVLPWIDRIRDCRLTVRTPMTVHRSAGRIGAEGRAIGRR